MFDVLEEVFDVIPNTVICMPLINIYLYRLCCHYETYEIIRVNVSVCFYIFVDIIIIRDPHWIRITIEEV